jgi:hypothetical protein
VKTNLKLQKILKKELARSFLQTEMQSEEEKSALNDTSFRDRRLSSVDDD